MKRKLKPNERIALLAATVAVLGGTVPLLARTSNDGPLFSGDFVSGFLLGLIGMLLVGGVAWWLKGRAAD